MFRLQLTVALYRLALEFMAVVWEQLMKVERRQVCEDEDEYIVFIQDSVAPPLHIQWEVHDGGNGEKQSGESNPETAGQRRRARKESPRDSHGKRMSRAFVTLVTYGVFGVLRADVVSTSGPPSPAVSTPTMSSKSRIIDSSSFLSRGPDIVKS